MVAWARAHRGVRRGVDASVTRGPVTFQLHATLSSRFGVSTTIGNAAIPTRRSQRAACTPSIRPWAHRNARAGTRTVGKTSMECRARNPGSASGLFQTHLVSSCSFEHLDICASVSETLDSPCDEERACDVDSYIQTLLPFTHAVSFDAHVQSIDAGE